MKQNKNFLTLQLCTGLTNEDLSKRFVFLNSTAPENPEKQETKQEKKEKQENTVDFKKDFNETLSDLAAEDDVLKTNYIEAIAKSLATQGYKLEGRFDSDDAMGGMSETLRFMAQLWSELEGKCKKVEVKNNHIRFLDANGKDVAPKQRTFTINIDVSKLRTTGRKSEIYDVNTGKVTLRDTKNKSETNEKRVYDLFDNISNGARITVQGPKEKAPRKAEFVVKDGKKMAYYINEAGVAEVSEANRVKIWNGSIVKLDAAPVTSPEDKTTPKTEEAETELFLANRVGVITLSRGQSLEKTLKYVIGETKTMPEGFSTANIDEGKLQTLRDRHLKYEDYAKFLNDKNALTADGQVYLLIPEDKTIKVDTAAKRQLEAGQFEAERARYFGPELIQSFKDNRKFKINSPEVVALIDNPTEWRNKWNNDSIEGLRILKGVINSEPTLITYKNNPEKVRNALQKAIEKGNSNELPFSDIVDVFMHELNVIDPKIDYSDIQETINTYFTANGELKPQYVKDAKNTPKFYDYYRNIVIAANKVGYAVAGLKVNEGRIETSKQGGPTAMLRNARLESKAFAVKGVFNANELVSKAQHREDILGMQATLEPKNSAGIQISEEALPGVKMQTAQDRLAILQTVLRAYSLQELIDAGCIKKGESKDVTGEFYVIDNLPAKLKEFLVASGESIVMKSPNWNIEDQNVVMETVSPQKKYTRLINTVFPTPRGGTRTSWNDAVEQVGTKYHAEEAMLGMDSSFARSEFMEMLKADNGVDEKGQIKPEVLFAKFNQLIEIGLSRLPVLYPNPEELNAKMEEINQRLGLRPDANGYIKSNFGPEQFEYLLQHPKAEGKTAIELMQKGFVSQINSKEAGKKIEIAKQRAEIQKKLAEGLSPAERAQLEDSMRRALERLKVPKEQIDKEAKAMVEKAIPIIPAIGYDTVTNTLALGVGVWIPVLEGKYGKVYVGGGAGLGFDKDGVTPGVGVGAGYETMKVKGVSLVIGAGAGIDLKEGNVGFGGGAGLNFDLGGDKYEHNLTIGLTASPFGVIPGVVFAYKKNHENRMKAAEQDALRVFGFEAIDKETNPTKKAQLIMQNKYLGASIIQTNNGQMPSVEKVLADYELLKNDLVTQIDANYDPTGYNGMAFGIGIGKDGKFIFGVMPNFVLSDDRKITYQANKTQGEAWDETQVEQAAKLLGISEEQRSPEQKAEIESLKKAGKVIVDIYGNLAVVEVAGKKPKEVPQPKEIASIEALQNYLNEVYKASNVRVEIAEVTGPDGKKKKMFELKVNNWRQDTNYALAVDPAMKAGGVDIEGGKIYLAVNFNAKNVLGVLRSNFKYALQNQGANYLSIITISDDPNRANQEIYEKSSKLLLAREGGAWSKQEGFLHNTTDRIHEGIEPGYTVEIKKTGAGLPENSAEFTKNYKNVALQFSEEPMSKERTAKIEKFAVDLMKDPQKRKDYKLLSNSETDTAIFRRLNVYIGREWKNKYGKDSINDRELALIRATLADESFSELGKKDKPEARTAAFKDRMHLTETIVTAHFQKLIDKNHKKYPEGDARRINMDAERLSRTVLNRAININVNDKTTGIPLKAVEQFRSLAATDQIEGFRGQIYTGDIDPEKVLVGASETNYAEALKDPNSADANIAKLVLESFSPLDQLKDSEFSDTKKVQALLGSELSVKMASMLELPITRQLFSKPEYRDIIVDMIANRTEVDPKTNASKLSLNGENLPALKEYAKLLNGIRAAEMHGDKYFVLPSNPDFRIVLKMEIRDGVYYKCTNYTYWLSEGLELQHRATPGEGFKAFAAQGTSTLLASPKTSHEFSTLAFAGGLAVRPEIKPPETPPITPLPPGVVAGKPAGGPGHVVHVDQPGKGTAPVPKGTGGSE